MNAGEKCIIWIILEEKIFFTTNTVAQRFRKGHMEENIRGPPILIIMIGEP